MEYKKLVHELEETVLRLHVNARRLEDEYKHFKNVITKIEKPLPSLLSQKNKVELSEWGQYMYYKGKMIAYMFILSNIDAPRIPKIIQDIRGMELDERGVKFIERIP